MVKDQKLVNCSPEQSFRKNVEMVKSSSSLVHSQRKSEGQKISAIVSKIFKLIMFQTDHISLTSADSYHSDSFCLARVFQNLPAPPKHYFHLLFHYYVIFPYKVKRTSKIQDRNTLQCPSLTGLQHAGQILADAKGATAADRIRMFWILLLENRNQNNIFVLNLW